MATVTSFNSKRMKEIEDSTVVRGAIEGEDQLILYTRDGTRIQAGTIKGGAPEWIQEYTPIIKNHTENLEKSAETLAEMHEDLQEIVLPVIEEMDTVFTETLPNMQHQQTQTNINVLAALEKAQQAQNKADDTVKLFVREYFLHDSETVAPSNATSGWSETPPTKVAGMWIWERLKIERNDNTQSYTLPVLISGDTGNTGPSGEDAVVLYIQSTKGTAFKNNQTDTQLQVTVYSGSKQITNIQELWAEFGPSAYLEWYWLRIKDSDFGIISASDSRLTKSGFTLSITPEDVDSQTTFRCVLNI